jgi:type II secretory pathway pseudopilin PulG
MTIKTNKKAFTRHCSSGGFTRHCSSGGFTRHCSSGGFTRHCSSGGFTLVELMIAIGIVITLAALSINALFRARITACETEAIKNLKMLQAVFEHYRNVNPAYPAFFRDLCTVDPPYLDARWYNEQTPSYSNEIQGYIYEIKYDVGIESFKISALPRIYGAFYPPRAFYIQQDGQIIQYGTREVLGATVPE